MRQDAPRTNPRLVGAQRVPSARIALFIRRDFVEAALCAELIRLIDAGRRPSTLADDAGENGFRTSESCDLAVDEPAVIEIDARLSELLGIDPSLGEPVQGQRYAVGQQFKLHTDYFEAASYAEHCTVAGQRTWTAMAYLNTPEAGGATRFKTIDKIVPAEAGKLLCWNNLLPGGRPNGATLHQGMKVRRGVKYIITKWYRERPWPR